MPQCYFETLEPSGDPLSKDGGNFRFGLYGEGSPTPSPGVRIHTTGLGPGNYRILRPRLTLPAADDLQVQMQARVRSTIVPANDFQGVGLQIRAFNTAEPINQVDINGIDTNQLLWLGGGPVQWRNLTAVHTIPAGVGADQFTGELLTYGPAGGYADVTSMRIRTIQDRLESWFNGGPDVRNIGGGIAFIDYGPTLAVNLVRGHRVEVNFNGRIKTSSDGRPELYLITRLREPNGNEIEYREPALIVPPMQQGIEYPVDRYRLIDIDRPFNQIRFRIEWIFNSIPSASGTLTLSNGQFDVHIGDVVQDGS